MKALAPGRWGAGRERRARMLAIVVADGEPAGEDAGLLAAADLLIAADGGARWLRAQGAQPRMVVGDLDSLPEHELADLIEAGATLQRHPPEKDASDTELAVIAAFDSGADRVVVLGAMGGRRLDHELANVLLVVHPALAGRDLRVVRGRTLVRGLSGHATLSLESRPGDTVTLLPVAGDVTGVRSRGLRYGLGGETLLTGPSLGLSNEVTELPAWVQIEAGSLVVIEIGKPMEGAQ